MNRLERDEERIAIFERDGWRCRVCGRPIDWYGSPPIAHRISEGKSNRKKFGNSVIDHADNKMSTCSLRCNDACNIGFRTAEAEELADSIRDKLLKE